MTGEDHGGPRPGELESLGLRDEDVIDFSVNVNPYGPAPEIAASIRAAPLGRYPDRDARGARSALARLWLVSPEEITIGHGAAELLWLLARTLLRPSGIIVIAGPTFSEIAVAARQIGGRVVEVRARADEDFALDERRLCQAIDRTEADVVYICAPNNPSGAAVAASRLAAIAARHPRTTFIIDQAFQSLSEAHEDVTAPRPSNAVLVRSLTKDHAIPGLRLGAVIASPEIISAMERERPAWHTGTLAQAAAIACASPAAGTFVAESREQMLADRRALAAALRARGWKTFTTITAFFLVEVGNAAQLREHFLAKHRILVRDCASFDLPTLIRLGARPARDQAALLAAWDATSFSDRTAAGRTAQKPR